VFQHTRLHIQFQSDPSFFVSENPREAVEDTLPVRMQALRKAEFNTSLLS
jgi:hypothetical protein